jgi:hypothetical protein
MLPIYLDVGSKRVLSGKSENTLCLQPYRKSGVMPSLYEYAVKSCTDRGMQFIWGFTSAVKAFERYGFTCYRDIEVLTRLGNTWLEIVSRLQSKNPLWRRICSAGKVLLKFLLLRNRGVIHRIEKRDGYEIRNGRMPVQDLQELLERLKSKHSNFITVKYDNKYLSWRVRDNPFLKYEEYQIYQGANLRAYAFVVLTNGIASISDLLSEDRYATSLLVHNILQAYAKKAGRFRFLANPKDPLAQEIFDQLYQFGFSVDRETSKSWNFVLRDLSAGRYEQIYDISNWHITGLWTEGFLY